VLPVLVLCGGRGSRLATVTGGEMPKALVTVAGRPFIDHQLAGLRDMGLRDIVLAIGIGGDQIRDHVGDGTGLDVRARYVDDGPRLRGTGGAVRAALSELPDRFWVTYGDTLITLDASRAEASFRASSEPAVMTVLHNRDRWGPSNAVVEGDRVVAYAKDPRPPGAEHIDYGLVGLTRQAFDGHPWAEPFDLAAVLSGLAADGQLAAAEVSRRFYEIGTPEALHDTEAFLHGNRNRTPRSN
jgi:NDP-sugar pyrophosphorylase family protein